MVRRLRRWPTNQSIYRASDDSVVLSRHKCLEVEMIICPEDQM